MKKLFFFLFLAGCINHSTTPDAVIPIKEIPVIDYSTASAPDRFASCEWLNLWDVYADAYGEGEIKLLDNYKTALDAFSKKIMSHPVGKRCMLEWHIIDSPYVNPAFNLIHHSGNACRDSAGAETYYKDFNGRSRPIICPWFEAGIKASAEKWLFIMQELKNRGTEIDYFSTENEQGFSVWSFVPGQAAAIDSDPRSAALIKKLNIKSVAETMNFFAHRDDFINLNNEMNAMSYRAFVAGVYKPILAIYPKIQISDYAKFYISPKFNTWETNGWPMQNSALTTDDMVSNGTDLFYLGGGAFLSSQHGNVDTGTLENTPWQAFIMSLNQAYAIRLSNPDKPFWPSMAQASWITWSTPELYKEHWRHLALLVDGFVMWGPTPNSDDYKILLDIFKEVDPILSFSDRNAQITKLIDWHAKDVRTCATANRKTVCRVTDSSGLGRWE